MDLERLKLTKSVKPKKSRDKVQLIANFFLPRIVLLAVSQQGLLGNSLINIHGFQPCLCDQRRSCFQI